MIITIINTRIYYKFLYDTEKIKTHIEVCMFFDRFCCKFYSSSSIDTTPFPIPHTISGASILPLSVLATRRIRHLDSGQFAPVIFFLIPHPTTTFRMTGFLYIVQTDSDRFHSCPTKLFALYTNTIRSDLIELKCVN